MERRILGLTVLLVIVAISGSMQVRSVSAWSSLVPHVPILINGNSSFVVGQNGVTSGSGTAHDPYIIEGWSIEGLSGAAIEIEATTDFFIIRNVTTIGGPPGTLGVGIYLVNADNGSVLNSTLSGGDSVRIDGSQNVIIARNKLIGGQILVIDTNQGPWSTNLAIANNTLIDTPILIGSCEFCLQNPTMMSISGNTILSHDHLYSEGIFVSGVGVTVANNTISGTGSGISVVGSLFTIRDNILHTTGEDIGIDANSTTVSGNIMTGTGIGIGSPSSPYDMPSTLYPSYYDSQLISPSNLVNGSPVFYYSRCAGPLNLADETVGQLIIASCAKVQLVNVTTIGKVSVGILLAYVKQAKLLRDHIDSNCNGLVVIESSDVNVSDSEFASNICTFPNGVRYSTYGLAISVSRSTNFTLAHSRISGSTNGIHDEGSTSTTITGNLFASNGGAGGEFSGGANLVVSQNQIRDSGQDGLFLDTIVGGLILGNWISGSGNAGISVLAANGLNITANTMIYNSKGVDLGNPFSNSGGFIYNTIVYHNNFVYNTVQADYLWGLVLSWDNGYPSGGNYWSDYNGTDQCSGPHQDICPKPDGTGDTPYAGIIQTTTVCYPNCSSGPLVDHYPLMTPFGNVTQDAKPPQWPFGSTLELSKVSSTSVSLQWSKATDDTWVSEYLIAENGTVIARVQGDVLSYTVSGLIQGSTYVFKIDASDPASQSSSDGPSSTITLPALDQNPKPNQGQTPKPTTTPVSNTSLFSVAWWMQNPMWGYVIGSMVAIVAGSLLLVRRRLAATKTK